MRNRLITVLVGVVVGVIVLYGVPRAYFVADYVQDTEQQETQRSAEAAVIAVTERERGPDEVTPQFLEQLVRAEESIDYTTPDGTRIRVGLPVERDTESDIVAARSLADGGQLTLRRSADQVSDRVAEALLPLFLIGLALVVVVPIIAWVLAGRLSRPFRELAGVAESIGQGRFDQAIPHYRMVEAEAIADALRRAADRWAELMRRERDIATNASHELRTPISALRVEIEDLASWPQTPPDVAAELHSYVPELDRLNAAVRTYLDAAQSQRLTDVESVDLAVAARAAMQRWEPGPGADGPGLPSVLVQEPEGPMPVRGSAATVDEILDHLFRDADDRGASLVRVELECTESYGRVRLTLEGEMAPATEEARVAAARTALAVDGRVSIVDGHSTLLLPRPAVPAEPPPQSTPAT